jgi:uncharacterized membrane protein
MSAPHAAAWRAAVALLALVGYGLLSNWLMAHAPEHPWTVALLFGPLLLAVAALGWQRRLWWTLAACAALLAALGLLVQRGGVTDLEHLYVLQHGGIHLALAWSFATTLRAGHKPLITALAEGVHRRLGQDFPHALTLYTRGLTQLWTAYFLAMIPLSALLYALASWAWWSLFCTVLTPLSVATLFVTETLWRYRRHPEFPRVSIQAVVQAWQQTGRSGLVP